MTTSSSKKRNRPQPAAARHPHARSAACQQPPEATLRCGSLQRCLGSWEGHEEACSEQGRLPVTLQFDATSIRSTALNAASSTAPANLGRTHQVCCCAPPCGPTHEQLNRNDQVIAAEDNQQRLADSRASSRGREARRTINLLPARLKAGPPSADTSSSFRSNRSPPRLCCSW